MGYHQSIFPHNSPYAQGFHSFWHPRIPAAVYRRCCNCLSHPVWYAILLKLLPGLLPVHMHEDLTRIPSSRSMSSSKLACLICRTYLLCSSKSGALRVGPVDVLLTIQPLCGRYLEQSCTLQALWYCQTYTQGPLQTQDCVNLGSGPHLAVLINCQCPLVCVHFRHGTSSASSYLNILNNLYLCFIIHIEFVYIIYYMFMLWGPD